MCLSGLLVFGHGVKEGSLLLSDSVLSGGEAKLGSVPSLLLGGLGVGLFVGSGVGANSLMSLLVQLFKCISFDALLDVRRKLLGICLLIVLLEFLHVLSNVTAKDVFSMRFSIKALTLVVVARESLARVRDVKATIDGALERTKYLVTGGGSRETSVEKAPEWAGAVFRRLNVVLVTIDLGLTFVKLIELHLGQEASSQEEPGAVVSGVVLEANRYSEFGELVAVSCADYYVSGHSRVDHLADDVSVGGSHYQSVLGRVELVLVLSAQAASSLVIGLAILSSLKLGLVSLEVSLVLLDFDQAVGSLLSSILIFTRHFGPKCLKFSVSST